MYLKFPDSFLIPVKLVENLIDDVNSKDLRSNKEEISKTKIKKDIFIEEGLKDIQNKKIWEEIDEEYAESQSNK